MLRCRAHLCCCVRAAASVEASFDRLAQRRHLRAGACDWPAPKEDAGPSVSMRTVELCGRPSPHPLPGLRSASGSPRACLWFTRYHNRLRAAQSSVRLYRVMKSHQSLVRKSRARHGIVLPYGGWRMPAPASRRARGRLTSGEHPPRRFSPHTRHSRRLKHFTSERLSALAAQRGAGEHFLQYFYSSTRVSQRPPVACTST